MKQVSIDETEQKQLIADLRTLHRDIMFDRRGKPPIDVEAIIDEMHAEREYEVLKLRA